VQLIVAFVLGEEQKRKIKKGNLNKKDLAKIISYLKNILK